jgi:hypothetical protein
LDAQPPETLRCASCQQVLDASDKYCPHCGQKNITKRITVWELFQDFWDTVFSIDSKIFRTLAALLRPGKLTRCYFSGQHGRYIPPIRLFFFSLVAFVFALSLGIDSNDIELPDLGEKFRENWTYQQALEKLDSALVTSQEVVSGPQVEAFSDSLREAFLQRLPRLQDSIDLNENIHFFAEAPLVVSIDDLTNLSADSIIVLYGVKGLKDQVIQKQKIRFIQDGQGLVPSILGKLTWMILLMMPFLALFLKLLYIRRSFFFVEHLVFSFHIHAFVFLFLTLIELTSDWLTEGIILSLLLFIPLYLFFGMKYFYGQRFFKTFLKFFILGNAYLFIATFFTILTLLVGFLFF